jgi:lipoprotein signal peptidase
VQIQQQQRSSYKRAFLLFTIFFIVIRVFEYLAEHFVGNTYYNTGIAFALEVHGLFLYIVTIGSFLGLAYVLRHNIDRLIIPILFILAGGTSNVLDRIVRGAVVDPITIGTWQGNCADIAIFCSIFYIGWSMIITRGISTHASTH